MKKLPPPYFMRHRVLTVVSLYFGVSKKDLLEHCNLSQFVLPRQVAIYMMRMRSKCSGKDISRFMHRDHTTGLHAYNKIKRLINIDETLRQQCEDILDLIDGRKEYHSEPPVSAICERYVPEQSENEGERENSVSGLQGMETGGWISPHSAEAAYLQYEVPRQHRAGRQAAR